MRKELYPLIEERIRREGNATAGEATKNLNGRVSAALIDGRFDDSILMLREFKQSGQPMKLGTVQRWVRDIDLNTLVPDKTRVRVLDLVLRCTDEFKTYSIEEDFGNGLILSQEEWEPCPKLECPKNWRDLKLFSKSDV